MENNRRKILIRADASPQMGVGHLMRAVALSQLLTDAGYKVYLATRTDMHFVSSFMTPEDDLTLEELDNQSPWDASNDSDQLLRLAQKIQPDWVVLDGYHFDADYERRIKTAGYALMRIDDIPSHHYYADIVLNPNYGAEKMVYSTEPGTRVLAGLRYVLLRREFRAIKPPVKVGPRSRPFHVLVSLGGASDKTDEMNFRIIQGLSQISGESMSATLLAGHLDGKICTAQAIARNATWPIEIKKGTLSMTAEMAKADLAIVSAGSTIWELAYMCIPFLTVSLTQAQRDYLPSLAALGICRILGWHSDVTPETVQKLTLQFMHDAAALEQARVNAERLMDRNRVGLDVLAILDKMPHD